MKFGILYYMAASLPFIVGVPEFPKVPKIVAVEDRIADINTDRKTIYAVVVDAGSTGSRILSFEFHKSHSHGQLVLEKELYVETEPGLSAFADEPEKAVESISGLLDKAKDSIPQKYWANTPLVLKATAGLRLLPAEKAEALLNAIRDFFDGLPFLTGKDSVEIMDGTDEGIFSWFTVNFLLKVQNANESVAALDLGGGSTQVTFPALTEATLNETEFIHNATLPFGTTRVYTNSYLGFGIMAARKEILTNNHAEGETEIYSKCVNPIIKRVKFLYDGVEYFISGWQANFIAAENAPIVDYGVCSAIVRDYVLSKAKAPEELQHKEIYAFNYYFDRAVDAGLISESSGGITTLENLQQAAERVCAEANAEQPFLCVDLAYISILLETGFGLNNSTKLFLYRYLDGHPISWALGVAYDLLKTTLN